MNTYSIRLEEVSKIYGENERSVMALRQISLNIKQGEFLAIMGPSGAGKTTLLTLLGAMNMPTSGKVYIGDQDIYQLSDGELSDFRNKKIGFVFQQQHLLPYLTAMQNIMLPLVVSRSKVNAEEKSLMLLSQVGLAGKEWRLPDHLSGGEQVRVAIARALVNKPQIILADEPTGNLDSKTGAGIISLLEDLNAQGHTIIIVTHNPDVAKETQRTIYLADGSLVKDEGRGT